MVAVACDVYNRIWQLFAGKAYLLRTSLGYVSMMHVISKPYYWSSLLEQPGLGSDMVVQGAFFFLNTNDSFIVSFPLSRTTIIDSAPRGDDYVIYVSVARSCQLESGYRWGSIVRPGWNLWGSGEVGDPRLQQRYRLWRANAAKLRVNTPPSKVFTNRPPLIGWGILPSLLPAPTAYLLNSSHPCPPPFSPSSPRRLPLGP